MEESGYTVITPTIIEMWGLYKGVKLYATTDNIDTATDPIKREDIIIQANTWKIKTLEEE